MQFLRHHQSVTSGDTATHTLFFCAVALLVMGADAGTDPSFAPHGPAKQGWLRLAPWDTAHFFPFGLAGTVIVNTLSCEPSPQVAEHSSNGDQDPTQFTTLCWGSPSLAGGAGVGGG